MNYLELLTIENLFMLVGSLLILFGCFLIISSAVGILRMPDFYTKCHAAGVGDSLGCPMILLGLACHAGLSLLMGKILLLVLFIYIVGPTSSYCIAQAAMAHGLHPAGNKIGEEKNE